MHMVAIKLLTEATYVAMVLGLTLYMQWEDNQEECVSKDDHTWKKRRGEERRKSKREEDREDNQGNQV